MWSEHRSRDHSLVLLNSLFVTAILIPHSATPELLQLLTPSSCAFALLAFGGLHALNKPVRHRPTIQRLRYQAIWRTEPGTRKLKLNLSTRRGCKR
jgi:hypothetical protein